MLRQKEAIGAGVGGRMFRAAAFRRDVRAKKPGA